MIQHPIPSTPFSHQVPPPRSPLPALETVPAVLDHARRIRFAQRLAVLIRRIQAQHHILTTQEHSEAR